jgi:hypothetical protein
MLKTIFLAKAAPKSGRFFFVCIMLLLYCTYLRYKYVSKNSIKDFVPKAYRPQSTMLRTAASAIQKSPQARVAVRACAALHARSKSSGSFTGSSVDETWQQRRDVSKAETWASIIPQRSSFQSSVDDTWQQRREVSNADTWAANIAKLPAVDAARFRQILSSVDESWEDRRGVSNADTWAANIAKLPTEEHARFRQVLSSVDESWEDRRGVSNADSWVANIEAKLPAADAAQFRQILSSLDESWEDRRGISSADTWAANNRSK